MTAAVDLSRPRRVHLVGVGGAGMSGIARMLLQRGHTVSGSDLRGGFAIEGLRAMGARVRVGHAAAAVDDAEVVVASSAVRPDNVEVLVARQRGVPVLHRSEMLAALMTGTRAVLVSGTHGKTTTTSMTVVALQAARADPSFAIGGALNEAGSNAHAGTGSLFVAEADESDRSFLAYAPDAAVVTNVELDHPDAFTDLADVQAAFAEFLSRLNPGAPAIVCADDPGAAALLADLDPPVVTYGTDAAADVRLRSAATPIASTPAAVELGDEVVPLLLAAPGHHNLLNATAALAVCSWAGVDLRAAAAGLASFAGPQRRFQRLGSAGGVEVVDDYAHHPTEVAAALAAARAVAPQRVVLVVQPHRYSRTAVLGAALGRAAAAADVVVVTEVYGAEEEPVPGVTGALVADAVREAGTEVRWQPHLRSVVDDLVELVRPGDLVLVTGAGDVTEIGPALLVALRSSRAS